MKKEFEQFNWENPNNESHSNDTIRTNINERIVSVSEEDRKGKDMVVDEMKFKISAVPSKEALFLVEFNEGKLSLSECVELFALGICEDIASKEKRTEEIVQKCKILDSLSNALSSIKQ